MSLFSVWTVLLWYMCIMFNLLSNAVWDKPIEKFERWVNSFCRMNFVNCRAPFSYCQHYLKVKIGNDSGQTKII